MATQKWRDVNKEHIKEYKNKWYRLNGEKHRKDVKDRRKKAKEWLKDYKLTLRCSRCGESHPASLDFHHKDPAQKDSAITVAINHGWGMIRLLKEM